MSVWLIALIAGLAVFLVIYFFSAWVGQVSNFYFAAPVTMMVIVLGLALFVYHFAIKRQAIVSITKDNQLMEQFKVGPDGDGKFNSNDFFYMYFPSDGGQSSVSYFEMLNELTVSEELSLCREYPLRVIKDQKYLIKPAGMVSICINKKGLWPN
ncbi:MAG: hypothetical protein OEY11_13985 [Gammaproteobacteria bacterium]|nr:hypothetical protein [Gammaproteobacteria bacterium]